MLKNPHLLYRLKKYFTGHESGIVERVEDIFSENLNDTVFSLDDINTLPQRVTYRTPLGELKTATTSLEKKTLCGFGLVPDKVGQIYPEYEIGQKYP